MAQHEEIVLWLDRRWKNAIEKHLKGETLQEHLETVLDALCNQLPQREYERISREIYAEDAANREAEEAARTYAAYHVMECGQEWYFKTSPGEELLTIGKKLRSYITSEKVTMPDLFIKMFAGGRPITAEEYNALRYLLLLLYIGAYVNCFVEPIWEGALNFFLALCVVDGMVSAMMRRLENDPNSEESVPDASNLHADL